MAISISHTVGVIYRTPEGQVTNTTDTYTGGGQSSVRETLPIATNTLVNVAVDVSAIKSMVMFCTKDCTVKTNSSGAPDNTISLLANKQLVWNTDHTEACPLTVDVTKIYCTVIAVADLTCSFLMDATP